MKLIRNSYFKSFCVLSLLVAGSGTYAQAEPTLYLGAFAGLSHSDNEFEDVNGFVGYGQNYILEFDDTAAHLGLLFGSEWDREAYRLSVEVDVAKLANSSQHLADPVGLDETVYTDIDGLASIRGRIAVPFSPNLRIFAAGGVAFADIRNKFVDIDFADDCPSGTDCTAETAKTSWFDADDSFSEREFETGWLAGLGVELDYSTGWTARLDVSYFDFGKQKYWVNNEGFTSSRTGEFVGRQLYSVENTMWLSRIAVIRAF